jgi:two-component system phosphate regulon sensor histidine kinase PhoR
VFNLSLRQKIFFSYLVLFVAFIAVMYPFGIYMVKKTIIQSMDDRTAELIAAIKDAPDNVELVKYLKEQKPLIFFRVSIITDERKILYDSHTRRLLGPEFTQEYVVHHPEVIEAFRDGKGYHEEYSDILGQDFAYFAKSFDFHGKTYVMRTAFPFNYVNHIIRNFEIMFSVFLVGTLMLFSALTWFIVYRFTRPINEITAAIRHYQSHPETKLPPITLQSASPKDEFGQLAATINALAGIVQRQIDTLRSERNAKSAILDALVEGVVAVDDKHVITYINNMGERILTENGISPLGKPLTHLKQPVYEELVTTCQGENQPMSAELQMRLDGRRLYLNVVAVPTADTGGAVFVIQDTTSHHKMMEMRKNFIANASHELKTPLTIIRGFAEVMMETPDMPVPKRVEISEKIMRNTVRMTNLIKDLLILSDVENLPQSRVSEMDLLMLLEHCKATMLQIFPNATVNIRTLTEGSYHLMADRELLELAFNNLFENAGKYCRGPVTIETTLTEKDGKITITVGDNGMGIPKPDLEHIFQRFYTVDKAHSRRMGGSGLGLSIVETIIEKHGGKIGVDSEVNVGTTFTIVLPTQLENLV